MLLAGVMDMPDDLAHCAGPRGGLLSHSLTMWITFVGSHLVPVSVFGVRRLVSTELPEPGRESCRVQQSCARQGSRPSKECD